MFGKIKRFFGKSNKIGSGLTVNLKNMMDETLSKDSGFIYVDAKGDREVLNNSKREADVHFINFDIPQETQKIKIDTKNM